jgi:hypothetical protein
MVTRWRTRWGDGVGLPSSGGRSSLEIGDRRRFGALALSMIVRTTASFVISRTSWASLALMFMLLRGGICICEIRGIAANDATAEVV